MRPGRMIIHVPFKLFKGNMYLFQKIRIMQPRVQFRRGYFLEHFYRIVITAFPNKGREFLKNNLGFRVPGPPKISGEEFKSG